MVLPVLINWSMNIYGWQGALVAFGALHCKYIRPDYDGTLAIHRSTIVVRTTIIVRTTMNG